MAFSTLAHHIDVDFLRVAYALTRKSGAAGVDGQTAALYEKNLEENLRSLLERVQAGTYHAPPVKRVYIPKGDGTKLRPIGIPTFEDKLLQRAVAMIMEAIYEQDFCGSSYGFRPGRSAHHALEALWRGLTTSGVGVVLELDIQNFFGELDHRHLRAFLDQRLRDGVLRRLIDKWLQAGVLEEGRVHHPESGTPQGGVISPILSNVYLHAVLDRWFESEVQPRLKGKATLIRYADDAVIAFADPEDARRVMDVLPKRFAKYGLTLHPEKTRLVPFQCPSHGRGLKESGRSSQTFDFLGFTHYWARTWKGRWTVRRQTARSRFSRALKSIRLWLHRNLHLPIDEQLATLRQKLLGHYGYYGITGNIRALARFQHQVVRVWRGWLGRRSQKSRLNWKWFNGFLSRCPLPDPRIVHGFARSAANPCL